MCKSEMITMTFDFVRETKDGLDVIDDAGHPRYFEKARYEYVIDEAEQTATITMSVRSWERRVSRPPQPKPMREALLAVAKVLRRCLNCKHEFEAHPNHRICGHCKGSSAWRSGSDYSLYS